MTDVEQNNLGLWSNDDFEKTVHTSSEAGTNSDLPGEVRFVASVAKLIKRRIGHELYENDPKEPAIFLLEPKIVTTHSDLQLKRIPMLDNGREEVNGRLWFVNAVVRMGHWIKLREGDDDAQFRHVTDDLGLGDVPAVIFDPRPKNPEFRFYPNGLNDPDFCHSTSVIDPDISLDRIFEVIQLIYEKSLVTPDAQDQVAKLWKNARKRRPIKEAEHMIQHHLRMGMLIKFPTCTIWTERGGVSGRLDIEIEERNQNDHSIFKRHALLELKVLREYGSSGQAVSKQYTIAWVEDGVKQAASYRDERGTLAAALCCFDMRKKDTGMECFDHVLDLAKTNEVELQRWFIFASSKEYRNANITTAQKPD